MLYIYGIVPAAHPPPATASGVAGAEVEVVEHAGIAALTSRLESDTLTAAREVRAHWRVLDETFRHTTVLPLRFGTVLENEAAVREQLLEPAAGPLTEMLKAMEGRVQLNVRGRYGEEELLREIVRESTDVGALREQLRGLPEDPRTYGARIQLGELVAAEIERRRAADTRLALDALEPLAVAASEERIADERAAFNLAFLVERSREDEFGKAVGALRRKLGDRIDLRYVGPLPPYSFADADHVAGGTTAWA